MRKSQPVIQTMLETLWRDAAKRKLRADIVVYRPRIVTIGPLQLFHIREIAQELGKTFEFSWYVDHDCHDYSWKFDDPEALKYL